MKKYTLGIIGAGVATQNMHLPTLANIHQIDIKWISDVNDMTGHLLASSYGIPFIHVDKIEEALTDCDIVLLSIPLQPRRQYYEMLSKKGIAVMAEKPFAINVNDHTRFQDLFPPNQAAACYQRRFFSSSVLLKQIVKEKWFGELNSLTFKIGGRVTKTGVNASYQDLSFKKGGGILVNLGCHILDLAFHITDTNEFSIVNSNVTFDEETDRHVDAHLRLQNQNSKKAIDFNFTLSWLEDQSDTLEFDFDNVRLSAPFSPSGEILIQSKDQKNVISTINAPKGIGAETTYQAFYLLWMAFIENISMKNVPDTPTATSTLRTAKLIDALLLTGWDKRNG